MASARGRLAPLFWRRSPPECAMSPDQRALERSWTRDPPVRRAGRYNCARLYGGGADRHNARSAAKTRFDRAKCSRSILNRRDPAWVPPVGQLVGVPERQIASRCGIRRNNLLVGVTEPDVEHGSCRGWVALPAVGSSNAASPTRNGAVRGAPRRLPVVATRFARARQAATDRKSTRLNSSHRT